MTIDIIGAGIGGLSTAIALERKNFKVRIFEQTPAIKPVGAGIVLANNAMQVFEKLGIRKLIEENGNIISSACITKANLKPISKVDLKYFEQKYKVKNIAIHRGTLQQILVDQLKSGPIYLDHKLKNITQVENKYKLTFDNNEEIISELVIAADGQNSNVRQKLFPNSNIRNAKQICWRGVTEYELPNAYKNELNEAWGKGDRFGFVKIAPKKVYWFGVKSYNKSAEEYPVNNISSYYTEYADLVNEIIKSTPINSIHTAEIADLKPTNVWHKNNVCLLGDAAHATTPNLGQGACQAIEDAYVLSECLNKYRPDCNQAFDEYQKIRLPKAHNIVNTSWTIGKVAHFSNPLLIGLRNMAMQIIPKSASRKQTEQIFKLANL